MPRLSHLFDGSKRENNELTMETTSSSSPGQYPFPSNSVPQSPRSTTSSNTASPAGSLFSTRTHNRFPSSGSSLASSPGLANSADAFGAIKTHLTEVKEEPQEREVAWVDADNYFPHFNDFHATDNLDSSASVSRVSHEYDLSIDGSQATSYKKRRSGDQPFKGISLISTRLSSMSSKWKHKQLSDTASTLERYDESLRSRANSATSTLVSPAISSLSTRQSPASPSPARTVFEERLNEANLDPLDIDKANDQNGPELERHATTPLLPPVMTDIPNPDKEMPLNSPLQSPTVADSSESPPIKTPVTVNRVSDLPTPPISTQPSLSSITQPKAPTAACGADTAPPPMTLEEPVDEWSHKLGHANFTVLPEPYIPSASNLDTLGKHRTNWELARCNFAKHLVRTGEHYGSTSNIYKLTEEKWESINNKWQDTHNHVATNLADGQGNPLSLRKSNIHTGEAVKIPGLHDKEKFPDLGDEDIVGPMSVAPQPQAATQDKPRKRSFIKFLQDLFC